MSHLSNCKIKLEFLEGFGKRGRGWFTSIEASDMQVAEPYCKTDNLGRVIIPSPFPLVALYLLSFSYAIRKTLFRVKEVDTKINYSHSKVNSEQSLVFLIIETLRVR